MKKKGHGVRILLTLLAVALGGATFGCMAEASNKREQAAGTPQPAVDRTEPSSQSAEKPVSEARTILAYMQSMKSVNERSLACSHLLTESLRAYHLDPGVLTDTSWKRGVGEGAEEIHGLVKEAGDIQAPPVCQKLHANMLDELARMQTILDLLQQAGDSNDVSKCAQAEADFPGLTAVGEAGLTEQMRLLDLIKADNKKDNDEARKARGEPPVDGKNKYNDDPPIKDFGDSMTGVTPVATRRVRTSSKPGWYLVDQWSRPGFTANYTNLFTITAKKWRISWDCGPGGSLDVGLGHGKHKTDRIVHCDKEATGVVDETVQGDFYLLIAAEGTWHVRVEEYQE